MHVLSMISSFQYSLAHNLSVRPHQLTTTCSPLSPNVESLQDIPLSILLAGFDHQQYVHMFWYRGTHLLPVLLRSPTTFGCLCLPPPSVLSMCLLSPIHEDMAFEEETQGQHAAETRCTQVVQN